MSENSEAEAERIVYNNECGRKAFKFWAWAAFCIWEAAFVLVFAFWPDLTWSVDLNKLDMEVLVIPSPTMPPFYSSFVPYWRIPLNYGTQTPANYCVTRWAANVPGGSTTQKQAASQPLKRVGLSQFVDAPGDETCQGMNAGVPARITGYIGIRLKILDRVDLICGASNRRRSACSQYRLPHRIVRQSNQLFWHL